MKTYRIGIVGSGFGVSAHLPALVAHPRFEVVALASPNRATSIARERGIAHAFESCQAMVNGCDLDAVTVASPPFAHEADVLASLARGLHVVCEKPFALDVDSAQRMLDAAARSGCVAGVAHEFRFVPQLQALRELALNAHLGALRSIEVTCAFGSLRSDNARARSWWFERARGGGMAGATLSHLIDLASWLVRGEPLRAVGVLRTANPQRHDEAGAFRSDVDDGAFALIDYGNALVARLAADGTSAVDAFVCAVHGETRTAVASGTDPMQTTLYAVDADETSELGCKPSPHAKFAAINPSVPLLMDLYDAFVARIEGGPSDLPTFAEGLATQRVLAAVG